MKHFLSTCTAFLAASALVVGISTTLPAQAADNSGIVVLGLGDDQLLCSDGGETPAQIIADYYHGTAITDAAVQRKAVDLDASLSSDANMKAEVKGADVIVVSAGMNDVVIPMLYESSIISASNYSTLEAMTAALSRADILNADVEFAYSLPAKIQAANAAIVSINNKIHSLNPDATVVWQTVNNPMGIEFTALTDLSGNRQYVLTQLYYYLNACLEGGSYSSLTLTADGGINDAIRNLGEATSDYTASYDGAKGEEGIGLYLSNIANLNMEYSSIGSLVLASNVIASNSELTEGDGTAITNVYNATGQADTLSTWRSTFPNTINTVAANTTVSYATGDADQNGSIDVNDAFIVLQHTSNLSAGLARVSTTPAYRVAIDADADHNISVNDAFLWLNYVTQVSAGLDVNLDDYLAQARQ